MQVRINDIIIIIDRIINNEAILVHVQFANFATGWTGDPCLPIPKAGFELATLRIVFSCSTNWAIQNIVYSIIQPKDLAYHIMWNH